VKSRRRYVDSDEDLGTSNARTDRGDGGCSKDDTFCVREEEELRGGGENDVERRSAD
jgi:hypothetical protein